jgi:hypothetical protein
MLRVVSCSSVCGDFHERDSRDHLRCGAEIRDLAKTWQNCLVDCLFNVNDGTSAIYLSDQRQAVCFLCRHGRMGWFLVQAKGPRNVDIAMDQLAEIYHAFADAGIPPSSMVEAIKGIVLTHEWSGPAAIKKRFLTTSPCTER